MLEPYQPLYLKYRPQTLSELVGQTAVTQTLKNAIEHDRICHAYLFTGPRGCGKTSSARILAKSLNCDRGPTATPCLECTACLEIKQGISTSVIEIDAASNNSVDDARLLIERAPLVAQSGKFKIYIIDECHMLTKEAFNALLKTIEEPPPKVVFILATTEEHKVPATIVSRCQRLMFRLVNQPDLTAHLRSVADKEKIEIDNSGLDLVVRRSGGGLRDALGLLDQASLLSSPGSPVTAADLLTLLGAVNEDILLKISAGVAQKNGQNVLESVHSLMMEGREPAVLSIELAKHFLNLAKANYLQGSNNAEAEAQELILGTPGYIKGLLEQASGFDRVELAQMVEQLDKLEQSCRRSSQPALTLEVGMISLCHRHDILQLNQLEARVAILEAELNGTPSTRPQTPPQARAPHTVAQPPRPASTGYAPATAQPRQAPPNPAPAAPSQPAHTHASQSAPAQSASAPLLTPAAHAPEAASAATQPQPANPAVLPPTPVFQLFSAEQESVAAPAQSVPAPPAPAVEQPAAQSAVAPSEPFPQPLPPSSPELLPTQSPPAAIEPPAVSEVEAESLPIIPVPPASHQSAMADTTEPSPEPARTEPSEAAPISEVSAPPPIPAPAAAAVPEPARDNHCDNQIMLDEIWSGMLDELHRRSVPSHAVVKQTSFPISMEGETLTIGTRSEHFQKLLEGKAELIKTACTAVTGHPVHVKVKLVNQNTAPRPATAQPAAAAGRGIRSAPQDQPNEEGERAHSPAVQASEGSPKSRQFLASQAPVAQTPDAGTPDNAAPQSPPQPRTAAGVAPSESTTSEPGLAADAYKIFDGPGSRRILPP